MAHPGNGQGRDVRRTVPVDTCSRSAISAVVIRVGSGGAVGGEAGTAPRCHCPPNHDASCHGFLPTQNLFLTYVSEAAAAARFYGDLFEMEPVFTSPRYVAFRVAPDVLFAVWTGAGRSDRAIPASARWG